MVGTSRPDTDVISSRLKVLGKIWIRRRESILEELFSVNISSHRATGSFCLGDVGAGIRRHQRQSADAPSRLKQRVRLPNRRPCPSHKSNSNPSVKTISTTILRRLRRTHCCLGVYFTRIPYCTVFCLLLAGRYADLCQNPNGEDYHPRGGVFRYH